MSRPATIIEAIERQSRRITVASLCCNADEAGKDYHPGGHNAFSSSDVPTRTTYQQLVHPAVAVALPSLMSVHCQHHGGPGVANTLCCVRHLDTTNISGAPNCLPDSTSGGLFHDDGATSNPSMINADTALCQERALTQILPPSSTISTTAGESRIHRTHHNVGPRVQAKTNVAYNGASSHTRRPARVSYTEEQKFFIMFHRIVRGLSWPVIEDIFMESFSLRTRDGLTSVYYRIRKEWGMEEVSRNKFGPASDRKMVADKARHFSKAFLQSLGHVDHSDV